MTPVTLFQVRLTCIISVVCCGFLWAKDPSAILNWVCDKNYAPTVAIEGQTKQFRVKVKGRFMIFCRAKSYM